MIISIMQPYFFPYIGYFQLIAACDLFLIADDAQYIQGGCVNRNRILTNSAPSWITMPVAKADHRLPIGERRYLLEDRVAQLIRRRIIESYRKAPCFADTMTLVDRALGYRDPSVAAFNVNALKLVAKRLGIVTPMSLTSALPSQTMARGQALVIDRCTQLGASCYLNPIGGTGLYDSATFERAGMDLRFLEPCVQTYTQFAALPVPSLSIIDVLMFNDLEKVAGLLRGARLVAGSDAASVRDDVREARAW